MRDHDAGGDGDDAGSAYANDDGNDEHVIILMTGVPMMLTMMLIMPMAILMTMIIRCLFLCVL